MIRKPFGLCGMVVHGHGRGGTQLGFPTANLQLTDQVTEQLQAYKNYVVYGWGSIFGIAETKGVCEGPYPFAASIGFNPHFQDKQLTVEVHFLHEFEEDFYGSVVRIVSLGAIREMCAFTSLKELVDAINGDVEYTRRVLQSPELEPYKTHPFLTSPDMPSESIPYFEHLSE